MDTDHLAATFPELDHIEADPLRTGVIAAWERACVGAGIDSRAELEALPWLPPAQRALGTPADAETLVAHVRDVTALSLAMAERLTDRRDTAVDRDLLVAGALVHDVSKLAEFDGMEETPVYDLLGHPYWGVHLVAAADLPVECAHIVLSHTSRTTVEPAFIEAELVRRADEVAASAVRLSYLSDLRDA